MIWATVLTVTNLIYHVAVNQSLAFLTRRLRELSVVKHIVGPTIGSAFIVIILYYTFLGIAYPFVLAAPIVAVWDAIGIYFAYRKRKVPLGESDVETAAEQAA
ncbi:hypothetical protein [Thermogymnomonas acidicola]|uniref:hypothetical protein n=1 Tax=Thermogymnomonas acidicola TaxID=399579 RepID=UPI00149458D1|nr:hypothetical protein [Thermogymnomonas acidicola]